MDSQGEPVGVGKEGSDGDGRADEERQVTQYVDPWIAEATKKGLPEAFIENLKTTDGFTEAQKAVFVAHVDDAEDFRRKRAVAVEVGRRHGEVEANSRRETGAGREGRIARAMAYAAWEFDGKPLSSLAQRTEFGVPDQDVAGSLERSSSPRILRKGRS